MSIELVSRVLRKSGYGGAEQQVLVILCDYADDQGYCYPSMLRIAWETGLTERAVRNVMRRLEANGTVITTEHRGARNSNEYQIHLENGPQKEPWETYRDRNKRPTKSERGSAINQNVVPHKPEADSEIERTANRNVVPPKSEPDDRKSEPDDTKIGTSFRGTVREPSIEPPVEPSERARAKKPAAVKTAAPDSFDVTEDLYVWAWSELDMQRRDVDRETAKMLDHFRANGEKKADWLATWRNWMRRSREFAPKQSNGRAAPAKETTLERNIRNLNAAFDDEPEPKYDNVFDTKGYVRQ